MTEQLKDHQRGCAGRDYTCTCGYDDAVDPSSEWQSGYDAGIEAAVHAAKLYLQGTGPWTLDEIGIDADDYLVKCFLRYRQVVIEECANALEDDAKLCDCAAREERECGCGAWCEWKSITSARAIEIVRALVKETPVF